MKLVKLKISSNMNKKKMYIKSLICMNIDFKKMNKERNILFKNDYCFISLFSGYMNQKDFHLK